MLFVVSSSFICVETAILKRMNSGHQPAQLNMKRRVSKFMDQK